jgi:hypothetical protein
LDNNFRILDLFKIETLKAIYESGKKALIEVDKKIVQFGENIINWMGILPPADPYNTSMMIMSGKYIPLPWKRVAGYTGAGALAGLGYKSVQVFFKSAQYVAGFLGNPPYFMQTEKDMTLEGIKRPWLSDINNVEIFNKILMQNDEFSKLQKFDGKYNYEPKGVDRMDWKNIGERDANFYFTQIDPEKGLYVKAMCRYCGGKAEAHHHIWPQSPPSPYFGRQTILLNRLFNKTDFNTYFKDLPAGPWATWNLVSVCNDHHPKPLFGSYFISEEDVIKKFWHTPKVQDMTFGEFYKLYGTLCVFNNYILWLDSRFHCVNWDAVDLIDPNAKIKRAFSDRELFIYGKSP